LEQELRLKMLVSAAVGQSDQNFEIAVDLFRSWAEADQEFERQLPTIDINLLVAKEFLDCDLMEFVPEPIRNELRYTPDEIAHKWGGMHNLNLLQKYTDVLNVLSSLPIKVVDFITEKIYIYLCGSGGQYIPRDNLKRFSGQIVLCESLWNEEQDFIDYAIVHEIAHAFLNHKSPMFSRMSADEFSQQEIQVDELATTWGFRNPKKVG